MLPECPECGQKLRPQWVRCPRCRALLPGSASASAVEAAPSESAAGTWVPWLAIAGVSGIVLVGAVLLAGTNSPRTGGTVTAATVGSVADATAERAQVDPTSPGNVAEPTPGAPAFDALDSKRAASAAYASGDFETALAALEAAVAAAPGDPEARNNLGQLLVRHGRAAEALPHFDEAVRLTGERWDYRFNRARAYGLIDRWPEAVSEYRAALQIFPDDHATLYNLGLAQMRVKDYAGAAASLEQAVAAAPEEHDFLITLGTAYVGAAQPDRARATFTRFLQAAPDDPQVGKVKALLQALADPAG